jgi:hypothetical protein
MSVTQSDQHAAQRLWPTGWLRETVLSVGILASSGFAPVSAHAIDVHPTVEEVQVALDQGKEAAQRRSPPETFYGDAYGFAGNPAE